MVNGQCPSYLRNKIELIKGEGRGQTRQEGIILISRCKIREEQKMLLYDGFKMYNNLLKEINNLLQEKKLQSFKRMLVSYIRSREG